MPLLFSVCDILTVLQDGRVPERYPVQGILGWPFFSAGDHPTLLEKLQVGPTDRLERYDLSTRRWEGIEVSETFKTYSHQVLLWRAPGIVNCPDIDSRIYEAERHRLGGCDSPGDSLGSPTVQVTLMAAPARPRRKRERTDDGAASRPMTSRRLDLSHKGPCQPELTAALLGMSSPPEALRRPSPFLSNPPSSCTPPPPSSTPSSPTSSEEQHDDDLFSTAPLFNPGLGFSCLPTLDGGQSFCERSPALDVSNFASPMSALSPVSRYTSLLPQLAMSPGPLSSPSSAISPESFNYDYLWLEGRVHVPDSVNVYRWPNGMYSRDMVQGFRLLAKADRSKLKEEFAKVFPGIEFKSTYYRQEEAWKTSTETERIKVASLPRTREGLWTEARQSLSGWKRVANHH